MPKPHPARRRLSPLLAALVVCALPGLAHAETDPGITAAIRACAVPGASLEARVQSLAEAGWLTQSDSPAGRDRSAALVLLRFGADFPPGKAKYTELFERGRAEPLALATAASLPPDPAAVVAGIADGTGPGVIALELPAQYSGLQIEISTTDTTATTLAIRCTLALGPDTPFADVLTLVPTEGSTA